LKEGESVVGSRTRVKVVKNKVAPPFREAEFDILYGKGISKEGDILDLASARNIIDKSGAWFSYKGERLGQGRENVRLFLMQNRDLCLEIENQVRKDMGLSLVAGAPTAAAEKEKPADKAEKAEKAEKLASARSR
jgi:recombination protein RecA